MAEQGEPKPKPAKPKGAPKPGGKAKKPAKPGGGRGRVNPLVTLVTGAIQQSHGGAQRPVLPSLPSHEFVARAADLPMLYTFTGFLGAIVPQPGNEEKAWQQMYLDVPMRNWLLVEEDCIRVRSVVDDDDVPGGERDVIWVTPDGAVGIGTGSQSLEAQFLTGEFTRAADFRASPAGGTLAAATGVFCEAESIGCCRPSSR